MLFLSSFLYILFILGSLFVLYFPEYYFSELILSFLPYSIIISFLGLLIGIVVFMFFYKRISIRVSSKIRFFFAFLVLGSAFVFFLYSKKFTYFYNAPVPQIITNMTGGLKILYANIYKNNIDYTGIQIRIEQENPDVLFFVEFADHHYTHLKDFLTTNYPYSNSTRWSPKYVGNMVFSKTKIDNRADDFPQGAWRYAYFSINHQDNPIYFYLVHMSSPTSPSFFYMRNQQISSFFKDFSLHQEIHRVKQDKVVALGDFNTSPWSIFYWKFAEGFDGEFINITRYLPIAFTRKSIGFPLLWSHIDHIFVNKFIEISNFSMISIPGSDHCGFSFLIK